MLSQLLQTFGIYQGWGNQYAKFNALCMKPTANGTVHPRVRQMFWKVWQIVSTSLSGVHELVQLVQTEVLRTTLGLSSQKN